MEQLTDSKSSAIKKTVRDFIVQNFLYWSDHIEIEDDQSLVEEGIIDSTGMLELVGFLESTFEVTVADEEFVPENLDTLNAISVYIANKMNGRLLR